MKLTDTQLRAVKPTSKVQKLSDGGGLYLYVSPSGGRLWQMAYRFEGKQKTLSFGAYPPVSLKDARIKRDQAKEILASGVDPSQLKKDIKAAAIIEATEQALTFKVVALEWHSKKTTHLKDGYRKEILGRLERMLFPYIGDIVFTELQPSDILAAVRHAENRGAIDTAHRLTRMCGQVCRYAKIAGYSKYNVASDLTEVLQPVVTKHLATITDPKQVGELLRNIDEYSGETTTIHALKILPYVFVRSAEIRGAKWEEIDLDNAEWVIPAGRMKMQKTHIVPLAKQVVDLFKSIHLHTGGGDLVFPSSFSRSRCISDMGLLNALRRMGYEKGTMTIHGFRSMASTLLNSKGYNSDWIERQLAHGERNAIRAAYNHAEYLDDRRRMMQDWANYLDKLRSEQ